MKLIILSCFIGACTAALLNQERYLPPNVSAGTNAGFPRAPSSSTGISSTSRSSGSSTYTGSPVGGTGSYQGGGGSRPQDAGAQIINQISEMNSEGFSYSFETSTGIKAREAGIATNGVQAQGEFSYTGDDGQLYKITYTADENGYIPVGAHLPTSPPIPDDILRSLEQNAKDEANGILNDGSYSESSTNTGSSGQNSAPAYGGSGSSYSPGIQRQATQQSYASNTGYKY